MMMLEEFEGGPRRLIVEGPLGLPLTTPSQFIESIESILNQEYPCLYQLELPYSCENTKTLTATEKPKALNIPMSKATIGQWTHIGRYPDDLKAKFYFAKRKFMWEILDNVKTGTHVSRLKRKIELKWSDVLSFRATFHPHNETGTLEIEAGKHTQWEVDQDFTTDHSASVYRRHKLHFFPGDLQKTLDKLMSTNTFWSERAQVRFPTLPQSLYFDIGYGKKNDNDNRNFSPYGNYQPLSFDVSYDPSHHHHYPRVENFNTGEFGGSQVYRQGTQTNPMMSQQTEDHTISQTAPFVPGFLAQEADTENMDTYFHKTWMTDNICYCDQCLSNINY